MISPEWAAVGITIGVQLIGYGAMRNTVKTLARTTAQHARKIDRTEKAVILITPERQKSDVISILTSEGV